MTFKPLFAGLLVCAAAIGQDNPRPIQVFDNTNLPIQPIGKDDLLSVQIYDSPEMSRTVRVNAEGRIRLPMLKSTFAVEGLLATDVETLIADELKREELLVDPFVTVNVAEYHSRPISINGAVKTPTVFQAVGVTHLLDALAKGGGLAPEAGGEIIVTRPNGASGVQSQQRIPTKALIDGSDPQLNIPLIGGEEIRVPQVGTVVVSGSVKESGIFPVQDTGTTTVLTAIAQAKGFGDFVPRMVYIFRPDEQGTRHEIPVDLGKIRERKAPDVVLLPKDLLFIPENRKAKITAQVLQALIPVGTAATSAMIYIYH